MSESRRLSTFVAAATSVLLLVSACSGDRAEHSNRYSFTSYTQVGKLIPIDQRKKAQDVGGELLSGGSITLSKTDGRVRLINFFASWCGPCQIETPQLAKLAALDTSTEFLGVDIDDQRGSAKTFLSESGVHYPVVYDEAVQVPLQLGDIPGKPPFTVLIDKSNRVAAVYAGAVTAGDLRLPLTALARQH